VVSTAGGSARRGSRITMRRRCVGTPTAASIWGSGWIWRRLRGRRIWRRGRRRLLRRLVWCAAGRDGARVETGEQVRALARLEAEWRDRVVRFAKAAHDMGIAERVVELQQATARRLFEAYVASFEVVPELLPAQKDSMLRAFLAGIGVDVGHDGAVGSGVGVLEAGGS
jgi:hypothetical protein